MDRPRPVPPYLRVVDESAWVKGEKIDTCFSSGMYDAGIGHGELYNADVVLCTFDFRARSISSTREFTVMGAMPGGALIAFCVPLKQISTRWRSRSMRIFRHCRSSRS